MKVSTIQKFFFFQVLTARNILPFEFSWKINEKKLRHMLKNYCLIKKNTNELYFKLNFMYAHQISGKSVHKPVWYHYCVSSRKWIHILYGNIFYHLTMKTAYMQDVNYLVRILREPEGAVYLCSHYHSVATSSSRVCHVFLTVFFTCYGLVFSLIQRRHGPTSLRR